MKKHHGGWLFWMFPVSFKKIHRSISEKIEGKKIIIIIKKQYKNSRLIDCLSFLHHTNNFSVIWWRPVFIGGGESPGTIMYLVRDHWPSESKLGNLNTYRRKPDSNPHRQRCEASWFWAQCSNHSATEAPKNKNSRIFHLKWKTLIKNRVKTINMFQTKFGTHTGNNVLILENIL